MCLMIAVELEHRSRLVFCGASRIPWNFSVYSPGQSGHRDERWKAKDSQVLESPHAKRCRELQRKSSESNFYDFYGGFGATSQCRSFEPC